MGFEEMFEGIMHYEPYPWQKRLYERFINGNIPDALGIPTGLGKTSIIPIWLIALSNSRKRQSPIRVPVRLVYIVDRRVIVDQASDTARQIVKEIEECDTVASLLATPNVSTLRGGGGMADSRDWLRNPSKPAIIIGTVDMIGSRLFFSGYHATTKTRPFYAGMLGQDSLVVLDEAHLSPALGRALSDMQEIALDVPDKLRPPKTMLMSATRRPTSNALDTLSLGDDDLKHKAVRNRYDAQKTLSLTDAKQDDLSKIIVSKAQEMTGRTIIYVQKPRDAVKITKTLQDANKDAIMLTGTLRGFERDLLTHYDVDEKDCSGPTRCKKQNSKQVSNASSRRKSEIFSRFVKPPNTDRVQSYLVSTSAGEVGADFDADDMVSELAPFDSLIQRLGRVNRSGGRSSNVVVVYSNDTIRKSKQISSQLESTLKILKDLTKGGTFNASPRNIETIPPELTTDAISPSPDTQPLTRDIVDMWSMTSIYEEYAPRPAVRQWIRGHDHNHIPDTHVAWRRDVSELAEQNQDTISDIIDKYPLLPHETARDSTYSVKKILESRDLKHSNKKAIIIKRNSPIVVKEIGKIDKEDLVYSTLLLPCDVGGLDRNGALAFAKDEVTDVADDARYKVRRRVQIKISSDGEITLDGDCDGLSDGDNFDMWLAKHKNMKLVGSIITPKSDTDDETPDKELRYYVAKPDNPYSVSTHSQLLSDHNQAVKKEAVAIVERLGLDERLSEAVVLAAEYHDIGKSNQHWQDCMHCDSSEPLAKTDSNKRPLNLGGFRHEFESVLKISAELNKHRERDLVLHLIASHHGWARPCFKPNASNHADDEDHLQVGYRYASLQKRFGPWGLAWMEGLLRGADWKASEIHGDGLK